MARAALIGLAVYLTLTFGVRSLLQWRRTGRTGFVGVSGGVGSLEWWAGVLFVTAIGAGIAAPVVALVDLVPTWTAVDVPAVHGLGLALFGLGGAATFGAQVAMGDSWRIGVDATDRTALVASGPFRWVRNPIFTSMLATAVGLALLVPNAISALAVVVLVLALEVQVRWVEEPYLLSVHGETYRRYATRVGRFVPGVGCLPA